MTMTVLDDNELRRVVEIKARSNRNANRRNVGHGLAVHLRDIDARMTRLRRDFLHRHPHVGDDEIERAVHHAINAHIDGVVFDRARPFQ